MSHGVITWKGKPIDDLTHEELKAALSWSGTELTRLYDELHAQQDFTTDLMAQAVSQLRLAGRKTAPRRLGLIGIPS